MIPGLLRAPTRGQKEEEEVKLEEEMEEKEEDASGDRFLFDARPRMIRSLSMVGGVIKDPGLRPYELPEKGTKRSQREEEQEEKEDREKSKKYCGCRV